MASFYPTGTHFPGTLTAEDLRAIDALAGGTYTSPTAIVVESDGIRASGAGNPGLSFDGSGLTRRPMPAAADECRHCGCPFPESPCHYCGTKTRRER